jgi:hypothetical protein
MDPTGTQASTSLPILVVENRENWRGMLDDALKRNYRVQLAGTVDDAIERVRRTEFGAIILNPNLLGEDDFLGEAVLEATVRHQPLTPCILLSGRPELQADHMDRYRYQIWAMLYKGESSAKAYYFRGLFANLRRAINGRETVRELLSILDTHLCDPDCRRIEQELIGYYHYPDFRPPPTYTDNTKRQKLGYMIAMLVGTFRPSALYTLCDIAKATQPGNTALSGDLNRICPPAGRPSPPRIDSATRAQIQQLLKESRLQEALEILHAIDGYASHAIPLIRKLTDLDQKNRRRIIKAEDYEVGINQMIIAILGIIQA